MGYNRHIFRVFSLDLFRSFFGGRGVLTWKNMILDTFRARLYGFFTGPKKMSQLRKLVFMLEFDVTDK
jgi:hypothetical protein